MELRKVHIQAPVTVRACHLRFSGDGGADQYRRRAHLLKPHGKGAASTFELEGETMFKAGEVIETDYAFPKGMLANIEYLDEKPKTKGGTKADRAETSEAA